MIEPDLLYELSRLAYARPTIEPVARPRDEAPSAFFAALLLLMTKRSSYGCPATHCRRPRWSFKKWAISTKDR